MHSCGPSGHETIRPTGCLGSFQKPSAPSPTARSGASRSPRCLMSMRSSRQLCALSRTQSGSRRVLSYPRVSRRSAPACIRHGSASLLGQGTGRDQPFRQGVLIHIDRARHQCPARRRGRAMAVGAGRRLDPCETFGSNTSPRVWCCLLATGSGLRGKCEHVSNVS
jgi:hypothetical protein